MHRCPKCLSALVGSFQFRRNRVRYINTEMTATPWYKKIGNRKIAKVVKVASNDLCRSLEQGKRMVR